MALATALDVVEPIDGRMVIDVTCNAIDEQHAEVIGAAVEAVKDAGSTPSAIGHFSCTSAALSESSPKFP